MKNFLQHYGVLGMKWGVRRYQPYPKGKHGTFLGQSRHKEIRIPKGSIAYRASSANSIPPKGTPVYVTFDKFDHIKYLGVTQDSDHKLGYDFNGEVKNGGETYSIRLRLSEDLIAPSYQKTMTAFRNTVDSIGYKKFKEVYNTDRGQEWVDGFFKNYNQKTVQEMQDAAYLQFFQRAFKDPSLQRRFFKELKAMGYNAIVDEEDKGFSDRVYPFDKQGNYISKNAYANAPVIVFDRGSFSTVYSKKLSDIEKDYMSAIYSPENYSMEDATKYIDKNTKYSEVNKYWKNWESGKSKGLEDVIKPVTEIRDYKKKK